MENERAFLARVVWRQAVGRRSRAGVELSCREQAAEADPEQLAMGEGLKQLAHQLMDTLPAELREPLVLSALEELNSEEIGQILGLPAVTVRNRLMRARQVLKGKLANKEIKTRTPTAAAEFIGKDWVVLLSPDYVAGKHQFAAIFNVKLEPAVKAALAKDKR